MTTIDTASAATAATAQLPQPRKSLPQLLLGMVRAAARHACRVAQLRALASLDDYLLADIGVDRDEVLRMVIRGRLRGL